MQHVCVCVVFCNIEIDLNVRYLNMQLLCFQNSGVFLFFDDLEPIIYTTAFVHVFQFRITTSHCYPILTTIYK